MANAEHEDDAGLVLPMIASMTVVVMRAGSHAHGSGKMVVLISAVGKQMGTAAMAIVISVATSQENHALAASCRHSQDFPRLKRCPSSGT